MDHRAHFVRSLRAGLSLALLVGACGHAPRPYTVETVRPSDESLDLLARGFEQDGYKVSAIDRRQGRLLTAWRDTGERASEALPGGLAANVFARYEASTTPGFGEHPIRIRAEFQSCAAGSAVVTATEVVGICGPTDPPDAQQRLDDLGQRLAARLGATAVLPATAASAYDLHLPAPRAAAIQTLKQALLEEGLAPTVVDDASGVLATSWRDSGYQVPVRAFGVDGIADPLDLFRRYRLVVVERNGASDALLQVDGRRCLDPETVDERNIIERCQASNSDDAAVLGHDLRALAGRLAQRAGTRVTAANASTPVATGW